MTLNTYEKEIMKIWAISEVYSKALRLIYKHNLSQTF